ncbi:MAG: PD40 domain-containing protein [Phenylobacterium sp.]|nr:PD40 domain-containing protein [Phenylobacterium sp.]
MFWPESSTVQARLSLRKALSTIRQIDDMALIENEGEVVRIPDGALRTDLDDFMAADDQQLQALVDLYPGPFLQDFTVRGAPDFDDWVARERQDLQQRAVARIVGNLDQSLAAGSPPDAVAAAALALLGLDPLNERAHRVIMRVHQRQGRPSAALQQHRALAERLERELGVRPEAETEQLYREIRAGRAAGAIKSTPAPLAESISPAAPMPEHRPSRRFVWGALGVLLAAGFAVAGLTISRASPKAPELGAIRTVTSTRSEFLRPSLAPTGAFVVYSSRRLTPGNADLYLQSVQGAPPVRLTTHPAVDDNPAWSPDGASIAFTRRVGGGASPCQIVILAIATRSEKLVGDCPGVAATRLAWSPDLTSIYLSGEQSLGHPRSLYRLDVANGRATKLTTSQTGTWGDDEPVVSPDGRHVAFLRRATWTAANVFVLDLSTGRTRALTHDAERIWGLAWERSGKGVLFSSNRRGDTGLWWAPLKGQGRPQRLSSGLLDFRALSNATKGDRMAFEALRDRSVILASPAPTTGAMLAAIAPPGARQSDWFPAAARDGTLVFASDRSGAEQLWTSRDGVVRQLTDLSAMSVGEPRFSPDGSRVAFVVTRSGQADILVIGREGGPATSLTDDAAEDASPVWSPDGRTLYFASRRSGSWRIWRAPADGSAPAEAVTGDGPRALRLSGDGRAIYVVVDGQPGIRRAVLSAGRATGPWVLVEKETAPADWLNWDVVGSDVFYIRRSADGVSGEIRRRAFDKAADVRLADASGLLQLASFAVRPSGELLLTQREIETHLMVTEVSRR